MAGRRTPARCPRNRGSRLWTSSRSGSPSHECEFRGASSCLAAPMLCRLPDESADAVAAVTLPSSLPAEWFRERMAREIQRLPRPGGLFVVYDLRFPSRNRKPPARYHG